MQGENVHNYADDQFSHLSPHFHYTFTYYRKRPCISRTFFQKIEAKNQGCGLSTDTSEFRVLKNLINIHETS